MLFMCIIHIDILWDIEEKKIIFWSHFEWHYFHMNYCCNWNTLVNTLYFKCTIHMDYTLYNIEKNHYLQCWYLSVQTIFCDFKFRCNYTVLVSLFYHHLSVYCPYLVKYWQKSLSFQELFPSICVKYILNISSVILKSYHCISCLEWWLYMTNVITPCIGKSIQCFFSGVQYIWKQTYIILKKSHYYSKNWFWERGGRLPKYVN